VVILKAKDRLVGHEVLAVNAENLNLQQDDIDPVVHIMSHYPGYTHIKTLQTGLSFGEIALKLDIARSSTVVAA
jgi:CRP-like cAMP-binding protein